MLTFAYLLIAGLAILLTVRYAYLTYMRAKWRDMCVQYAFDSEAQTSSQLDEIASYMITSDMTHMVLEFWEWDFRRYVAARGLQKMLDFYRQAGRVLDNEGPNDKTPPPDA
jgi:hypothetical protein